MFGSPFQSVTVKGQVAKEIDLTLLFNERKLFSGSASKLEAALEAVHALKNLRDNHTLRQLLTQLVGNRDAMAPVAYLNQ